MSERQPDESPATGLSGEHRQGPGARLSEPVPQKEPERFENHWIETYWVPS